MRPSSLVAIVALCAAGCAGSVARLPEPAPSSTRKAMALAAPPGTIVPAGATLSVRLLDRLSGPSLSPGKRFRAELAQPVVSAGGAVVLPQGTRLEGHVRGVRAASPGMPGAVELVVDGIVRDGAAHPLSTAAVDAPLTTPHPEDWVESDMTHGLVLGGVIGSFVYPWSGIYYGGAVGGAGGAVASLRRKPAEPFVARGTLVTTWLEEPLTSPRGAAAAGRRPPRPR